MHTLFVSEGIVLGKRGVGEANVIVAVLTRNFGLIKAHVRSARNEKSKLRYGLEPLTLGRFTFVRGKNDWRLTGVEKVSRELISSQAEKRQQSGRVSRLLLRLIPGEEIASQLFDTAKEGFLSLVHTESRQMAESIETVFVLRILAHLGYLPHTRELRPFIETDFFSIELAHKAHEVRTRLIKAINESLSATGL
jgi:DNA repair protein RecO (recombination protein O)